jgi:hypothetical protein
VFQTISLLEPVETQEEYLMAMVELTADLVVAQYGVVSVTARAVGRA